MQLFYTNNIQGENAVLSEEESKHCTRVLRKKTGDKIHFIDGKGGLYEGIITEAHKNNTWIRIVSKTQQVARVFKIHIAIAPTKNISRTEWFLEKCTEMGVDEITFLECEHSERKKIRLDRLEKIVLSACKQSLKAFVPQINPIISYREFIGGVKENIDNKYICWVEKENKHLYHQVPKEENCIILIGPEGDFSKEEIIASQEAGFQSVGLGKSRLRTETAGIVACHTVHIKNEM